MRFLKLIIIAAFGVGASIVFFASEPMVRRVSSFSGGPPTAYTGAPGESDCSQCHANNPGPGEFTIVRPSTYVPGNTYQIVVRHTTTDPTRKRWGFELTALAGLSPAGTFQSLDANAQSVPGLSRKYVSHTTPGTFPNQSGGAQWTFNWTAPPANVGTVTFYAAGNQADYSGTPDGDQIYYALVESEPAAASPTPTPIPQLSVSGRVLTPDGRGLRGVIVGLTNSLGSRRTTTTSSFGLYSFENVGAGTGYIIVANSKRYRFEPQNISVLANLTDLNFVGLE